MSLSASRESVDLVFDAVPDKPREKINENNNENANDAVTDQVEDTSILDSGAETTRKSILIHHSDPPSLSEPSEDLENPAINPARVNKKKTDSRKKTSKKSDCSFKQGATIINISKSTGVHIGNNLIIQSNGDNTFPKPGSNTPKATKYIKKLLLSTEVVSVDHIDAASGHIGVNWMDVGRQLKYTDGQLEQFSEDNGRKGLKEVVYQMLLDWKRANGSKATVGTLANALWMSKQFDAVNALTMKPGKT